MAIPFKNILKFFGKTVFDPAIDVPLLYLDTLANTNNDFSQSFKRDKQFNMRDPFDKYNRFENGLNLVTSELETGIPANTAIKRLPPKVVLDPISGKEVTWYPRQIGNATIYAQPNVGGNPYVDLPDDLWGGPAEDYMAEEARRKLLAAGQKWQVDRIKNAWAERPYWGSMGENMYAPVRDQVLGKNQVSNYFSSFIPKQ